MNIRAYVRRNVKKVLWLSIGALWTSAAAVAGELPLANNALEVKAGVEPNVLVLFDNSGSMDAGMVTSEVRGGDTRDGQMTIGSLPYTYTHPDENETESSAPSGSSYASPSPEENRYPLSVVPDPVFLVAQGLSQSAAADLGAWRAWNSDYNTIYYNPSLTYKHWRGVNYSEVAFGDAEPTAAPYDPFTASSDEKLDLTTTHSYWTSCWDSTACLALGLPDPFQVTNFYPARYYSWTDTDGDGEVDPGDEHALYEIRASGCSDGATCPSSFTRPVFNEVTGIGRSDCGTDDDGDGSVTCTYANEIQNFANWFSYYRKRDLTAKAAFSGVIENVINARVGFAAINDTSSHRIAVASMNEAAGSGNKKALLNKLYGTRDASVTPLLTSLDAAGRYFACSSGNIMGSSSSSPGDAACPVLLSSDGGSCQQNYTILVTDGVWTDSITAINNSDAAGGNEISGFDGGAYGDSYNNTLADVAMKYYARDLHGTLTDRVPTTARDRAGYIGASSLGDTMHQHMSTYTVGFGVEGSLSAMPSDPTQPFSWPDPFVSDANKIDDLRHAAYNGRGQHLSATNPTALEQSLREIFDEIEGATGAASAVAFNTQNIESGSLVFRAFFNTKTNTGDLVAQRVNLDGSIDPNIVWSAARKLDNKTSSSSDSRLIVTYHDDGTTREGRAFRWNSLSSAQQALLDTPQPGGTADTVGNERLDYLRGHAQHEGISEDTGEFRERPAIEGKLGDIVHSSPVYVGKPPYVGRNNVPYPQTAGETYAEYQYAKRDRRGLVYVGANDGMLHAFDADTGEEVFAYVPNTVYSQLSQFTRPSYNHQFYVDGSPQVNDIYINNDWHTVLIGGLNGGGKGYYALDVSSPSSFTAESSIAGNVMWEFTSSHDSDLGYSFSSPIIAMSNVLDGSGNNRWVAIWGNGYNSTSTDGDSALFIAFIDEGTDGTWTLNTDYYKVSTGRGKAESSDGTTPNGIGGIRAIDTNGNGTVDYVYGGDLQGNLWRFDLTSTTASSWGSTSPFLLFQARYKTTNTIQPITTSPVVVAHPSGSGVVVVTATGSWMTTSDATNQDIQSIYGLWDKPGQNWSTVLHDSSTDQLVEQTFVNQQNTVSGFTVRTLSSNSIEWQASGNASSKKLGWYIDLDMPAADGTPSIEYPGERAIRNLQVRGGVLFVNTVLPRNAAANPCDVAPGGYELAFDAVSGGATTDALFDLNGDGNFNRNDNVGSLDGSANIVTGIRFDSSTPTDSSFIGNRRVTQTSDKSIRAIATNIDVSDGAGRHSWKELTR